MVATTAYHVNSLVGVPFAKPDAYNTHNALHRGFAGAGAQFFAQSWLFRIVVFLQQFLV